MSYIVVYARLSGLGAEEAKKFASAAAELGLDVADLYPRMAIDPGVTVLMSTTLGALLAQLAERFGADAATKLWDLYHRLITGHSGKHAIEDRSRRITFVWDKQAEQAGPIAAAAMISVWNMISAIPDGTVLTWDAAELQWCAAGP
jgi:hypothetical protein